MRCQSDYCSAVGLGNPKRTGNPSLGLARSGGRLSPDNSGGELLAIAIGFARVRAMERAAFVQSGYFAALEIGALEGQASAPPWGTNPPAPKFDIATTLVIVKGTSEARLAGLVAVPIAWITAILVCPVAILIGLVSGTGSGNSPPAPPVIPAPWTTPGLAESLGPIEDEQ
jgi:hypothetical protein